MFELPIRLRLAWHVLRGKPTMYRMVISWKDNQIIAPSNTWIYDCFFYGTHSEENKGEDTLS